jgi:anti-sigma B factor antagonist
MELTIQTISHGTKHRVTLGGEIDAYTGPKVKETIMSLIDKPGMTIIVDMEAVEYMDSTGIGVFVAIMKACRKMDCHFNVENMSSRVERLFRITGFYDFIVSRKGEDK